MPVTSPRTIEAAYVNGLLRPLEPMRDFEGQIYFVTILNIETIHSRKRSQPTKSLRGKYRGFLSGADEFASSSKPRSLATCIPHDLPHGDNKRNGGLTGYDVRHSRESRS